MSAFGRRNGLGGMAPGARPNFGVARPMKSGVDMSKSGGDQFPPVPGEDASLGMQSGSDSNPLDRKSTRLNSSHIQKSRMPSSA